MNRRILRGFLIWSFAALSSFHTNSNVSGASIEGQLICRKNRKDPRSLKVSISIDSETFQYLVQ